MTTDDHAQTYHGATGQPTSAYRTHVLPDEPQTLAVTADEHADLSAAGTPVVVVQRGPNTGSRFPLQQPTTSVGRHPHSDIYLDDITVSRRHAELVIDATGVYIVDLDSLRGTHVNGTPVRATKLADGDRIHIGKFHLTFSQHNQPLPR